MFESNVTLTTTTLEQFFLVKQLHKAKPTVTPTQKKLMLTNQNSRQKHATATERGKLCQSQK